MITPLPHAQTNRWRHRIRFLITHRVVHYLLLILIMTWLAHVFHQQHWRWADALDNLTLDTSFRLRAPHAPAVVAEQLPATRDIVIIELPHAIPQPLLARVILQCRQAKVTALDLMLVDQETELVGTESSLYPEEIQRWRRDTHLLAAAIHTAGNVALGAWTDEAWGTDPRQPGAYRRLSVWQRPHPSIWAAARYHAHLSVAPDLQDHLVRHVPLFIDVDATDLRRNDGDQSRSTPSERLPCLALAATAAAEGIQPGQLSRLLAPLPPSHAVLQISPHRIPYQKYGLVTIDYIGDRRCFEYGSNRLMYNRVLELYDPADFAGKVVFIGGSDVKSKDYFPTPYGTMSGVQIHANTMATLRSIQPVPDYTRGWPIYMVTLLCCILPILALVRWPFWSSLLVASLEIVMIILTGAWLYASTDLLITGSIPILAIILTYNAAVLYESIRIQRTLGKFIGPDMLRRVLYHFTHLRLGQGTVEEACAMFCDLRGYAGVSETHAPEIIATIMNEYTALVVATVRRYQGRPIDFAGDGVFVLFEPALAGRHFPLKAMHASLKLYKDFSRMQEKWLSQGIPILDIGIGIHIGPMMIGVMGSEQFLKMGASGDVVNIAARIQGLSQQCGYSVLVTQETYAHIQQEIAVDYCGDIAIKGRAKSVVVYGLTDTRLPFAMSESASTVTDIDASGFRIAH